MVYSIPLRPSRLVVLISTETRLEKLFGILRQSPSAHRTHCTSIAFCTLQVVAPKKAKLAEAESEYAELMVGLNAKKAELRVSGGLGKDA